MQDFYGTVAQVLPVVVLALVWESRYFEILRARPRLMRQQDLQDRDRFWTLHRVRIYSLTVATAIILDIAVCLLVLAGLIGDSPALRILVSTGVVLGLVSLLFRIWVHILDATQSRSAEIAQDPDDINKVPRRPAE
jgi:hypothetical protein